MSPNSRRKLFLALVLLLPVLGLVARAKNELLPDFLAQYLPDALWAMLVYSLVVVLRPKWPILSCITAAVVFSFGIELSQLYQADWINAVRATRPGALILGHGFLWSDLACYLFGIAAGAAIDAFAGIRSQSEVNDTDHAATLPS